MPDQIFVNLQQTDRSNSIAAPTTPLLNHVYFAFRGSFELHGHTGRAFYVWKDGRFFNDTLVFENNPVVPCPGNNLLGFSFRVVGPNPFFIFFGDETIGTADPDIKFHALMFSTDNKSFFPWPLHDGLSLRYPVAPAIQPGLANLPGTTERGQGIGNGSTFERHGLVFKLSLSHQDVVQISQSSVAASAMITEPTIRAAIIAAVTHIRAVDSLGGNNGVDIQGVIGNSLLLVTPRGVIDIIRAIEIVGGIVSSVRDESVAAVRDAVRNVSSGLEDARRKAEDLLKPIEDLGGKFGDVVGDIFG